MLPLFISPSTNGAQGTQIKNQFLTQIDLVNVLNWNPPTNFTPITYQIFRDQALTQLAGEVSSSTFVFYDHNRIEGAVYTYYIIAVDADGNTLTIGNLVIAPLS
jgi:hypothetical protein